MCYVLCLSPFPEMSDVVVISMLLSASHIPHVLLIFTICFGFHAIWSSFPCFPFPGLFVPPQAAGSFQSNLLNDQDRESGTLFREQDGERGQFGWGWWGEECTGEGRKV